MENFEKSNILTIFAIMAENKDYIQQTLFDVEACKKPLKRGTGGSANPIIFHDYEGFIAKFTDKPKTTDECYTPDDVYQAVLKWVGKHIDLSKYTICRPFYPGGDYENAEYPDNAIVIDNPPFSIFTKICKFYTAQGVPFFLFGPAMTIFSICDYCTAVVAAAEIIFSNKAAVRVNFASNIFGDVVAMSAPDLKQMIESQPSQNEKVNLPKYRYPDNVLSVSMLQTLSTFGVEYSVSRERCEVIKDLDLHPKKNGLFGNHLLLSQAQAQAQARNKGLLIEFDLSEREKKIVERLSKGE